MTSRELSPRLPGSSREQLNVRMQVYAVLRESVIVGDLPPGALISENDLAMRYGVSRTPVREAVIRLAEEDLVEVLPQRGTFVSRISVTDVREMQFVRDTLERASLIQAIERMNPETERTLSRILRDQVDAAESGDTLGWFATDEDFHRTLLEVAGHPKVWPIVHAAKAHLDRVRLLSLPQPSAFDDLHDEHAEILRHVVDGDIAGADRVMAAHLHRALDTLESLERTRPDYFREDAPQRNVRTVGRSGSRARHDR